MPKRISKVTFTSSAEIAQGNEQYFVEDVEELIAQGADDFMQLSVVYKQDLVAVKGIIGIRQGSLMNAPEDWIALPCPPYCHPDTGGNERVQGELSYEQALGKLKTQ